MMFSRALLGVAFVSALFIGAARAQSYPPGPNIQTAATSQNNSQAVNSAWVKLQNYAANSAAVITGGTIDNTAIGGTTPAAGAFTTLSTTGAATLKAPVTISGTSNTAPSLLMTFTRVNSGSSFPSMLSEHGTVSGSVTGGPSVFFNQFGYDTDSFDASGAQGGGAYGFYFFDNTSGVGGRTALDVDLTVSAGAAAFGTTNNFVPLGTHFNTAVNLGGTNPSPLGRGFGGATWARLKTGATYWTDLRSFETDIGVQTGASVQFKNAIGVALLADDAVAGSIDDVALSFGLQVGGTSSPGWMNGIAFGGHEGWWPMNPNATLIGTIPSNGGGPAYTAANGIDWSAVTFSGNFLNSVGYSVSGTGAETALSWANGNPVIPPAATSSLQTVLNIIGHMAGTITTNGTTQWNNITVVSDDLIDAGATNPQINDLSITHNYGGPNMLGGRVGFGATFTQSAANAHDVTITGVQSVVKTQYSFGGTNLNVGSQGAVVSFNPVVRFLAGSSNLTGGSGTEMDFEADSTATYKYFSAFVATHKSAHAVAAAQHEVGYALADQKLAAPTWTAFGQVNLRESKWPLASTAAIMRAELGYNYPASPATAAYGDDYLLATFGTDAFRSQGVAIDGSGNVRVGTCYQTIQSTGASLDCTGSTNPSVAIASGGSNWPTDGNSYYAYDAYDGVYSLTLSGGTVTGISVYRSPYVPGATPSNPVTLTPDPMAATWGATGLTVNLTGWSTRTTLQLNPSGGAITVGGQINSSAYVLSGFDGNVTATGTNRATAYNIGLGKQRTVITSAAAGTGAVLPSCTSAGEGGIVFDAATNNIVLYANGSNTINGVAGATGVTLVAGSSTNWICNTASTVISQ